MSSDISTNWTKNQLHPFLNFIIFLKNGDKPIEFLNWAPVFWKFLSSPWSLKWIGGNVTIEVELLLVVGSIFFQKARLGSTFKKLALKELCFLETNENIIWKMKIHIHKSNYIRSSKNGLKPFFWFNKTFGPLMSETQKTVLR